MQDVENIYREFGPKFCLCPFMGAFYQTNRSTQFGTNSITPCSVTNWDGREHTFDVVDNSIMKSMNSDVWKQIRQNFVQGEFEKNQYCKTCVDIERLGGHSPRIGANLHYLQHSNVDVIPHIRKIIDNNLEVNDIVSLDWFPSNYCNYSCIMCAGGASSTRHSFEIKIQQNQDRIQINSVDPDFYDVLRRVEILNFTGGETLMQPQITNIIQYLVDNDMAANKTIFFLTNCSRYPEEIQPYFSKFREVIFLCSIDGTGPVIEYQRRNSDWNTVAANALRLFHDRSISTVGNFVLTAVNALNVMDLVDWMEQNNITNQIAVSPVFRSEYLGIDAMPTELRDLALKRIQQRQHLYPRQEIFIKAVVSIITNSTYNHQLFTEFVRWIELEDQASQRPLHQAVPEWTPYLYHHS